MNDIFSNNAFSVVQLTDAINEAKHKPGRLGDMGLFASTSVVTLDIAIERIGERLEIVRPSPRGAPGDVRDMPKRKITSLTIPHFQRGWAVYADEVQGVREFGSEQQFKSVQSIVADKMAAQLVDFDVTEEHARLGAVKGVITYKGGATLDLFATFGVTAAPAIDFDLDNANPVDGSLRRKCVDVIRRMRSALGGTPFDRVHAFVGDNFFDDLLQHREVRETYKGQSEATILRESYIGPNRSTSQIFEFGGIVWESYGAVDTDGDLALLGIDTDEARFFPVGAPNVFRTYYAPADYMETVNTPGKRLYARQWPMPNNKGINGEVQMNALNICTRPAVLLKGKRT